MVAAAVQPSRQIRLLEQLPASTTLLLPLLLLL
jgi:hypothetical protein